MIAPVEQLAVAVSVDAVAQQRARMGAQAGTAVVVGREIAGRLRGGVEWRPEHGLAVAVVARPVTLEPARVGLVTLAAALAAADAVATSIGPSSCAWPDAVVVADDVTVRGDALTLLGPGRVDVAILVVRIGSPQADRFDVGEMATALVDRMRERAALLDRPDELRQSYAATCETLGTRVRVGLLPHGVCRGEAVAVGADGGLVVRTAGGVDELVPMSTVSTVQRLD